MTRTFIFKSSDDDASAFRGENTIFEEDVPTDVGNNVTGFTQFDFDGINDLVTIPDCYGRIKPSWNRATEPKWPPIEYDVYYNNVLPSPLIA